MAKTFKKIGGYKIEITNAEKELFPDDGITKGEVVGYYERIAETMLPYLKDLLSSSGLELIRPTRKQSFA